MGTSGAFVMPLTETGEYAGIVSESGRFVSGFVTDDGLFVFGQFESNGEFCFVDGVWTICLFPEDQDQDTFILT